MHKEASKQNHNSQNGFERPDFIPSAFIKPHHFFFTPLRAALEGYATPEQATANILIILGVNDSNRRDPTGYWSDLYGTTDANKQQFATGIQKYFTELYELPDSSSIHLDLQPDGLCKSCVGGKHCTATNFRSIRFPHCKATAEARHLGDIRRMIESAGHREGQDYIIKKTTHTLYDMGNKYINTPVAGKPLRVVFNSLIVNTGALRNTSRKMWQRM